MHILNTNFSHFLLETRKESAWKLSIPQGRGRKNFRDQIVLETQSSVAKDILRHERIVPVKFERLRMGGFDIIYSRH